MPLAATAERPRPTLHREDVTVPGQLALPLDRHEAVMDELGACIGCGQDALALIHVGMPTLA